jgi:hypothetical protein
MSPFCATDDVSGKADMPMRWLDRSNGRETLKIFEKPISFEATGRNQLAQRQSSLQQRTPNRTILLIYS